MAINDFVTLGIGPGGDPITFLLSGLNPSEVVPVTLSIASVMGAPSIEITASITGSGDLGVATGQSVLDCMEDLNPELQLQPGESGVARGLRALNAAQDLFEIIAATYPEFLGGQVGTVTTTAGQEYTTYPTGLLRIDGIDFISPDTGFPSWNLDPSWHRGGELGRRSSFYNLTAPSPQSGAPRGYWTNGTRIYWDPVPNAAHTMRWYGFQTAPNLTALTSLTYPDVCANAFCAFASKLMKIGLDDPSVDVSKLAEQYFQPLIQQMGGFRRDGARRYNYRYSHSE